MKSSTIRLNEFEAGILYAALQEADVSSQDQPKVVLLTQKLGNVLRQARIDAGIPMPVKHSVPKRRPLVISSDVELLEPRTQPTLFRQPK